MSRWLMQGCRGSLLLAPHVPGDIVMVNVHHNMPWCLQNTSFVASDESVQVVVKTQVGSAATEAAMSSPAVHVPSDSDWPNKVCCDLQKCGALRLEEVSLECNGMGDTAITVVASWLLQHAIIPHCSAGLGSFLRLWSGLVCSPSDRQRPPACE
jgi:hypothetical protein